MIDVSELMDDPDFLEQTPVFVISRTEIVNEFGEANFEETKTPISAIIQAGAGDMLESLPDAAKLSEAIRVWTRHPLEVQNSGGYSDIVVWREKRWVVAARKPWSNWGAGYTQAVCTLEGVNGN
jgi:hypothetical protein